MSGRLILIHGLKYAGKSTIADTVLAAGYQRVKFAGPLKNMARSLLRDVGMEPERIERCVEGDLKEASLPELGGATTRTVMEKLGDQWRRMVHPQLWAFIAKAKVGQLLEQGVDVVVDDLRYVEEIEMLSDFGPCLWVVTRGSKHFDPVAPGTHPGEIPIDVALFDRHFVNDGTMDELARAVAAELEVHGGRPMMFAASANGGSIPFVAGNAPV